jgi:ubiquitin carboxyl-terminal hydrolase 25/28
MATTVQASGPGKTGPKLCADFLRFDPQKTLGGNLLSDLPPHAGDGKPLLPHPGACKHDYTTKQSQSVTPPLDLRADRTTQYKLALICKACRIHVDIRIDYRQASNPCPNSEHPLHHFQYLPQRYEIDQTRIGYSWQCSSATCRAELGVTYKQARISKDIINLLTDTSNLKKRYDSLVAEDPDREGLRQATPVEALNRLRKYLKDALKVEHKQRTFPANQKRFMEAFGSSDCRPLLDRLGFQLLVSAGRVCKKYASPLTLHRKVRRARSGDYPTRPQ